MVVADPDGNTFEVAQAVGDSAVSLTEEAHVDRQRITDYLRQMKVEELVAVLRDVFADRQPAPEEATFCRNRFFLGTAWSDLQSAEGEPERWGPWQTDAVAYPNATKYGDSLGPDYGLCEEGTCGGCGLAVRSNVKQGLCPVCGVAVYMT